MFTVLFKKKNIAQSGGGDPWFRDISNSKMYPGISIYETDKIASGSAVTLPGVGIFVHSSITGDARTRVLQHEYGHYLDYKFSPDINFPGQISAVNFYMMIGVPSLFNASTGIGGSHSSYWTETRANRWAEIWFGDKLAPNFLKYYPTK
jgi:hypothetical protein